MGVDVDVRRAEVEGPAAERHRGARVPVDRLAAAADDCALDGGVAHRPPLHGVDGERARDGVGDSPVGAEGLRRTGHQGLTGSGDDDGVDHGRDGGRRVHDLLGGCQPADGHGHPGCEQADDEDGEEPAHATKGRLGSMSRPATLGQLRESGWESVPVKEEVRRNAAARIASGEPLFPGVLGYEETVLPQLENALLAGHDIIFLGERGQAKTRIIRTLTELLDEWLPVVAGSEINDHPHRPVSKPARDLIREHGDDTQIEWVPRDVRFGEKLATPDTSIADLIGEVDPIKVAEARYLSDELTLHYALAPRTNPGIFPITEPPDLAERIQVGLLNVLEERDVQVRGYKIRLPLDLMLVASANPEDYTNRGRIITPLKDRFGAQTPTHYPLDPEVEAAVVEQEARPLRADGLRVH